MQLNDKFTTALTLLLTKVQDLVGNSASITAEVGNKYVRVLKTLPDGSKSAYCFISSETGEILKAATDKAPAKGARGNLYNEDSWKFTADGTEHFKRGRKARVLFQASPVRHIPVPAAETVAVADSSEDSEEDSEGDNSVPDLA